MPLFNLSIFTPTPNREESRKKKDPLKICCMLFFDGTLNNKGNIAQREQHEKGQVSEIYIKNRMNKKKEDLLKTKGIEGIDLSDDSYENDYSNIVHLETNAEKQQPGFDETVIVYTEGSGTVKYEEGKKGTIGNNRDRMPGYAFSAASTGIKAKVESAIKRAVGEIGLGPNLDEPRKNTKFYIEKLTIDVFGFSRGAASARYCVHELLKDMATIERFDFESESTIRGTETNIQRLFWREHWLDVKEVEIRFVGLFDTVASYYATQFVKFRIGENKMSLENWLAKLKAIQHDKVKKVVHFASAEEHRDQFSLHNIKSALDKGTGEEYYLPGVHSDVGGGYLPEGSDGNLVVFQGNPAEAKQDRAEYLEALGWFKNEQLAEEVKAYHEDEYGNDLRPSRVWLRVKRKDEMEPGQKPRVVHNTYRLIPLRLMAEKAGKASIKIKEDLDDFVTTGLKKHSDLRELESKIRAHMGAGPSYWQKVDPQLNAIRYQHLHFSARYNGTLNGLGHNPRREKGKRKRYVFNG